MVSQPGRTGVPSRFKGDTDCHNIDFEETLKQREELPPKDMQKNNVKLVQNMSESLGK